MPNLKILKVSADRRREMRPAAERLYRQHQDQVPRLIRQLAGPTQAEHDRAFELLTQMGEMVISELLDRTLDDIQARFADRHLWDDIWTILDSEFGEKDVTWH